MGDLILYVVFLLRYRSSTASSPDGEVGEASYTIQTNPPLFSTPTKFSSLQAYKSKVDLKDIFYFTFFFFFY